VFCFKAGQIFNSSPPGNFVDLLITSKAFSRSFSCCSTFLGKCAVVEENHNYCFFAQIEIEKNEDYVLFVANTRTAESYAMLDSLCGLFTIKIELSE